ncbi:hypothetical protein ACIBEJ_33865 [Nonomuraea sp. NPDC050790]|uniref:hypothetical protein n=1 Tax=Nonomuraea sp. NPDC050790 TaxID=3364371 RepID=UPI0037A45786
MPPAAAPLLAAHLVRRRAAGARDDDPYFPRHDHPGRERDPERMLREAVLRTCHRIKLSPAWLRRSHCRHGDQIGTDVGNCDWLSARALTRPTNG